MEAAPKQYYECLNCHTIFPRGYQQNGKFCKDTCYFSMLKKLSKEEIKNLRPIPVVTPQEAVITQTPIPDPKPEQNEPVEVLEPSEEIPDEEIPEIDFEELSSNQIWDLIQNLQNQIVDLESRLVQEDTYLENIVENFVEKYNEYKNTPMCPTCQRHFQPTYEGQVFCNENCARSVLKHGVMRLENGKFVSKRKI